MFMGNIADLRGLTIDADIGLYYSIDTAINALPRALEKNGANTFLRHQCWHRNRFPVSAAQDAGTDHRTRNTFKLLAVSLNKTSYYNPEMQARLSSVSGILPGWNTRLPTSFSRMFCPDLLPPLQKISTCQPRAIDKGYAHLYQSLLPTTEALINARIQRKNELLLNAGMAFLLLLAVSYFFIGVYHSMIDSIQSLARSAQNFARARCASAFVWIRAMSSAGWATASMKWPRDSARCWWPASRAERLRSIVDTALDALIQMDASGLVAAGTNRRKSVSGRTYGSCRSPIERNDHPAATARLTPWIETLLASGKGGFLVRAPK